jgi:DNA polymerase III delta prime subunit
MSVRHTFAEEFAQAAQTHTLAQAYLLIGRDRLELRYLAEEVLRHIDGINQTQHVDALIVKKEDDANSIGIKVINEQVKTHLQTFPGVAPYRSALILDGELMTEEAQNALLKITEEPPERAVLVIATTDEDRLLPTLRSRLQRRAVPLLTHEEVLAWLNTQEAKDSQIEQIIEQSNGSLDRAQELLRPSRATEFAQKLMSTKNNTQISALIKESAGEEITLIEMLDALLHVPRVHLSCGTGPKSF